MADILSSWHQLSCLAAFSVLSCFLSDSGYKLGLAANGGVMVEWYGCVVARCVRDLQHARPLRRVGGFSDNFFDDFLDQHFSKNGPQKGPQRGSHRLKKVRTLIL